MKKTIGYLGPKGTFTEAALYRYLKKNQLNLDTIPFSSIIGLFNALENNECSHIIVPSENSVEGSVNTTLDLLSSTENIYIQEEWTLPIHQTLMTKPETELNQITDVISHTQALAQSKQFLNTFLPNAQTHGVASTALGAELIQTDTFHIHDNQQHTLAIIGNKDLAGLYGLKILKENIQDNPNNATRFFLIGKSLSEPSGKDKTSLILSSPKDESGGLCKLLQKFADQNINLTKIVSRPTQQDLGEYIFFIDCDGHSDQEPLSKTLQEIKTDAATYKLLGSYKHATLST